MSLQPHIQSSAFIPTRPGRVGIAGAFLFVLAQIARALTSLQPTQSITPYIMLSGIYTILFTALLVRPNVHPILRHLYLVSQGLITLALLLLRPDLDSMTAFFILMAFHVPFLFAGTPRWVWISVFALATPVSLVTFLGPLRGLAAGLTPMAASVLVPAIAVLNEEIQRARAQSELLVAETQETHRQLEKQASQAEELAALEERNRLARDLHDSVSQTIFAITLTTRSARLLLEREPQRVMPELERLQMLSQNALAEMRHLIAQRRP